MGLFSSSEPFLRRRRPKPPSSTHGGFQSRTLFVPTGIVIVLLLLAVTMEVAVCAPSQEDVYGDIEEAGLAFDMSAFSVDWGDPTVSEQVATQTGQSNSSSSSTGGGEGGSNSSRKRRRELYGIVDVTDSGAPCRRNPLWDRRVDAGDYEYGCRAIEHMLTGEDLTLIGSGKLRDVYLVEYEGRQLVVKTLKHVNELTRQKVHLSMHRREVLTLHALRGHENVVEMLGLCGTTVVTEYVPDSFKREAFRDGKGLPLNRVVSLALDIAKGVQALHETVGAVYVDMKPHQLLVDDAGRGVIANGLSSVHLMTTSPAGQAAYCKAQVKKPLKVVPWRAPENVAGEPVTEKADIYSMGVVFYSLMAGREPYKSQESFKMALLNKARPEIDPSWHTGFMKIVRQMWREDPKRRPSARQVVVWLHGLLEDLP